MGLMQVLKAAAVALTLGVVAALPWRGAFASGRSSRVDLRLSGHCFSIHSKAGTMEVTLVHARPQRRYGFTEVPVHPHGFGVTEGILTFHRATMSGHLQFSTTIPHRKPDVGRWIAQVYYRHRLLSTAGFTIREGSCPSPPTLRRPASWASRPDTGRDPTYWGKDV